MGLLQPLQTDLAIARGPQPPAQLQADLATAAQSMQPTPTPAPAAPSAAAMSPAWHGMEPNMGGGANSGPWFGGGGGMAMPHKTIPARGMNYFHKG